MSRGYRWLYTNKRNPTYTRRKVHIHGKNANIFGILVKVTSHNVVRMKRRDGVLFRLLKTISVLCPPFFYVQKIISCSDISSSDELIVADSGSASEWVNFILDLNARRCRQHLLIGDLKIEIIAIKVQEMDLYEKGNDQFLCGIRIWSWPHDEIWHPSYMRITILWQIE